MYKHIDTVGDPGLDVPLPPKLCVRYTNPPPWLSRSTCAPPGLPPQHSSLAPLLPMGNPQAAVSHFLEGTHTLCQESEPFPAPSLTSLAWWRVSFLKTPPTCRVCRMVSLGFPCSLVPLRIHKHTPLEKTDMSTSSGKEDDPLPYVLSPISVIRRSCRRGSFLLPLSCTKCRSSYSGMRTT